MKISDLFKRGKKEQEEIDKIIQANVAAEAEGKPLEEPPDEEIREEDQLDVLKKLKMSVEKLTAEMEILRERGKIDDEKFQRVSEEIGELRRAGIEREKKIDKTKLGAEKAIQLVNQVQPQNLMKEVEKEDAKFQALEAKEKADRELIDYITEEIKEVKSTIGAFRGMESLIEMNEEMKKELRQMKTVEAMAKKHADKVENLFVRLQRGFSKFSKLSQDFRALEKKFQEVIKESEEFKKQHHDLVRKKELENLQKDINKKLDFVDKARDVLEKKTEELKKVKTSASESEKLEETLRKRLAELDDGLSELTRMEEKGYITEEKFNQELEEFFDSIITKIESLESKIR